MATKVKAIIAVMDFIVLSGVIQESFCRLYTRMETHPARITVGIQKSVNSPPSPLEKAVSKVEFSLPHKHDVSTNLLGGNHQRRLCMAGDGKRSDGKIWVKRRVLKSSHERRKPLSAA